MGGFDSLRKAVAVDSKRAPGRDLVGIGAFKDDRAQRAHLAMQDPDRVGRGVVGSEGIRAHELGQMGSAVRGRACGSAAFRAERPEPRNSPLAMRPPSRPDLRR